MALATKYLFHMWKYKEDYAHYLAEGYIDKDGKKHSKSWWMKKYTKKQLQIIYKKWRLEKGNF